MLVILRIWGSVVNLLLGLHREMGGIKKRLDRVLANVAWCNLFPNHYITHLKPCKSEHVLLALVFLGGGHCNSHTQTSFHFEDI